MPTYDLVLLLPKMERTALKEVLKRNIQYVFEAGGRVRKLENMGPSELPYKIRANRTTHKQAERFLVEMDVNSNRLKEFKEKIKKDSSVIRASTFLQTFNPGMSMKVKEKPECTLHLDLLPPPYRPSVLKIQEASGPQRRREEKKKFKANTGLDFTPF